MTNFEFLCWRIFFEQNLNEFIEGAQEFKKKIGSQLKFRADPCMISQKIGIFVLSASPFHLFSARISRDDLLKQLKSDRTWLFRHFEEILWLFLPGDHNFKQTKQFIWEISFFLMSFERIFFHQTIAYHKINSSRQQKKSVLSKSKLNFVFHSKTPS